MKKLEATTILTRGDLGPGSEFGFENHLRFFALLAPIPQTEPNAVRHTLGFGCPAVPTKNQLLAQGKHFKVKRSPAPKKVHQGCEEGNKYRFHAGNATR